MDISTIIGFIGGAVLILVSVALGGHVGGFVDLPSILLVGGGTLATTFIKFKMSDVFGSFQVAMKAFLVKASNPEDLIDAMINYARIAKKEGLIALENEPAPDAFSAKALRYLSDGYDGALIEQLLGKEIRLTLQRHAMGQNVFKAMGDSAPAFGMIGTLVGLVKMLGAMNDPATIGPAMAVAVLTTLYGALLAHFIFLPIAEKLSLRSEQEKLNRNIVLEAAVSINRGMSSLVLEESLKIFLAPRQRISIKEKQVQSQMPAADLKEAD
ncbi:MAG: MotA/TolQ/ExbB proton channel family protein [Desulfobacteraceae bacterium]|nr:MotA/TolQ/ExbB proton channel family protein [Desulfobacteraceae bacterium]